MEFVSNFFTVFTAYIQELWLALVIGFLISGFFNEFIPADIVSKYLGQKGFKPILISSFIGIVLPVCCFGSLPIAMTMRKKGAKLGPTLAFLVATPATSVSALIVCWKLLGGIFTVYIFFAAVVIGLVMGIIGNNIKIDPLETQEENDKEHDHCCHDEHCTHPAHRTLLMRMKGVLHYAFIQLPKEIGLELILGVVVASLIILLGPVQQIIREYLTGAAGYVFSLIVGLATYVCSTASVPMADALLKSGLAYGPAMVYLLAGPITSYGMIFVLRKKFGLKVLVLYLLTISVSSILLGIGFDTVVYFLLR